MELQWAPALIGIGANTAFCLAMYLVQQWEIRLGDVAPHGSLVLGTSQVFLHWQDFYCQRYGNTLGLALVCAGFAHYAPHLAISEWIVFWAIVFADVNLFLRLCLNENHKPDWGYPESGRMSRGGVIHLVYHGLAIASSVILVWRTLTDGLNPVLAFSWLGGFTYLATLAADIKTGRFRAHTQGGNQ